jgi:D-sedoheptulose 7-phosphate isomerase
MSDNRHALAIAQPVIEIAPDWDGFARGVIRERVGESIRVKTDLLDGDLVDSLARLADRVVGSMRSGGKVILFGNGGSAADATHLAAEFVGRFAFDRDPMPALSLSDNNSSVTAIGNDYAYDLTFARQLHAFGAPGDVAIALSTSGGSRNVLAAVEVAQAKGMFTAAFTGVRGTALRDCADLAIVVPSESTARIQEGYMLYAHIMCELVEQTLFGETPAGRLDVAATPSRATPSARALESPLTRVVS